MCVCGGGIKRDFKELAHKVVRERDFKQSAHEIVEAC